MSGMAKLVPGMGASAGEIPGEKGPIPVVGVIIPWGPSPEEEETVYMELHAARAFQVDLNEAIAAAIKKQNENRKKRMR